MRRGNHLGAILGAIVTGAGAPSVSPPRRYYDPGATPIPARPQPAGTRKIAKFTRQLVRSIRRELTEHSFERAVHQATSLGWNVPNALDPLHPTERESWRRIWLAELARAAGNGGGARA